MRFYSDWAAAVCAAALVACGSGDDGDEAMFPGTGGGVGTSGGTVAAPGATTGPAAATGPTPIEAPSSTTTGAGGATTTAGMIGGMGADTTGGAVLTTGTAGVPPADGGVASAEISMKMAVFAEQRSMHAEMKCACYEVFGFASTQECLDSEPLVGDDQAECAARILSRDEAEGNLFFDCATPAATAHTTCLEQTFDCDRPYAFEAFQACASPYAFESSGCWELSVATAEGLSSCGLLE